VEIIRDTSTLVDSGVDVSISREKIDPYTPPLADASFFPFDAVAPLPVPA